MDAEITSGQASEWARLVAEQVEKAMPELVVSRMAKTLRRNKILITGRRTTARKPPSPRTVAAPRTWDEIAGPGLVHLDYREVLDRLDRGLDPMATLVDTQASALALAVGSMSPRSASATAVWGRAVSVTEP